MPISLNLSDVTVSLPHMSDFRAEVLGLPKCKRFEVVLEVVDESDTLWSSVCNMQFRP